MGPLLDLTGLPNPALVLLDSAPLIYWIEDHRELADRFEPFFAAHAEGRIQIAVASVTVIEVLTGPLRAKDEALTGRYRSALSKWRLVPLDFEIAEQAARLRATLRLKLADAIQAASAIAAGADALVSHDRDFSRLKGLRVIS